MPIAIQRSGPYPRELAGTLHEPRMQFGVGEKPNLGMTRIPRNFTRNGLAAGSRRPLYLNRSANLIPLPERRDHPAAVYVEGDGHHQADAEGQIFTSQ